MRKAVLVIISITFVICATVAGYFLGAERRVATAPRQQSAAPVAASEDQSLSYWSFDDLDGHERHMSEWTGELIVVNFWATWCAPCRREIPGFIALQDRYADQRVQFIGIAFDHAEAVRAYADEQGINYPVLIGEESVARYMRALGNTIGALPFSAVISRDGRVVQTHQGEWSQEAVEEIIRAGL